MDAVVKSTKRVSIVGVALDLLYMKISTIPAGARSTFAPFLKAGPARSAPVPVVSMIRSAFGRRQAYRILISRMGKRKKLQRIVITLGRLIPTEP